MIYLSVKSYGQMTWNTWEKGAPVFSRSILIQAAPGLKRAHKGYEGGGKGVIRDLRDDLKKP